MAESKKVGVLFVCLGNICRSPMAEAIFLDQISRRGWTDRFHVDSAGTGSWHAGETADPRTLKLLKQKGIPYDGRARAVRRSDFEAFDYLLAMDAQNEEDLHRLAPPGAEDRISRLLSWDPLAETHDVADPYYGGADGFERNYAQLASACEAFLDELEENELV